MVGNAARDDAWPRSPAAVIFSGARATGESARRGTDRTDVETPAGGGTFDRETRLATILASAILVAQLLFLFSNSYVAVRRGALTSDFQYNAQAVWEIGRGDLDPRVGGGTVASRYREDHGEFLMYAFGPLTRIFPTAYLLKFAQDLSIAGASLCVWLIVEARARTLATARSRLTARAFVLTLIACSPFTYWTNLFDFHVQVFAVGFLVAGLYFALNARRVLSVAMFLCVALLGDVAATYGLGAGVTLLLMPQTRAVGVAVVALSAADFELISKMKSGKNGQVRVGDLYNYTLEPGTDTSKAGIGTVVLGALRHPDRVFSRIADQFPNVLANVAPGGFVGAFHPVAIGPTLITLAEGTLTGTANFAQPGSQNGPVYPLVALGTALFVVDALRRRPRAGEALAAVLALNALGWSAVFIPLERTRWIRLSPQAAAVLNADLQTIPAEHQMVVNQGSSGLFAERRNLFQGAEALHYGLPLPTDVILTPYDGINAATSRQFADQLAFWLFTAHGRLVDHTANVWHVAFATWPPAVSDAAVHAAFTMADDDANTAFPAWAYRTFAGTAVIGPSADASFVRASGAAGYVVGDVYPLVNPGSYRVSMRYRATGPLVFEIYDPYTLRFLARQAVGPTRGVETVAIDVALPPEEMPNVDLSAGSGYFSYKAERIHVGRDKMLLRVYNPGGTRADVYSFAVAPR